jgi:excisionase family DNA binding protein
MSILTRTPYPLPKLLLTAREAAEALSICPRTLWALTRAGELRAIRVGGRGLAARALRYDVRDLLAWIDQRKERTSRPPIQDDSGGGA